VNNWEILADNLSKAGWSWDVCQLWTRMDARSGSLTLIATTGSIAVVRADEKLTAFLN
jgi:hypothetical protein